MKILDEIPYQEIDDWYEEQKELLDETMFKNLEKGVDYEKEKAIYDKKFKKLQREFNKKVLEAEAHNERIKKFLSPFQKFKYWKKKKILKIKNWWLLKNQKRKEKKFEKKFRKLFHIKEKEFNISKKVLDRKKD